MEIYFDGAVDDQEIARLSGRAFTKTARFDPVATRRHLVRRGFLPQQVLRYQYRPFDLRWVYWEPETRLLGEKSPEYYGQVFSGNSWLFTTGRTRKDAVEPGMLIRHLVDLNLMDSGARGIPAYIRRDASLLEPDAGSGPKENLSERATAYSEQFGAASPILLHHSGAILQSGEYRSENSGALRHDWPRIPLPDSKELLLASAELGRKVADLLDPETEVYGVTGGSVRPELKVIGVPTRVDGRPLNEKAGDLAVTAGWGHAGQGGVTMPGKGKINTRPWTEEERAAIGQGSEALGLSAQQALAQLGEQAVDVYLNDVAYWRGVPAGVWSYTIGGYQVMKKWLSYREKPLLGRDLKVDEVREVQMMARRIAAILLLQPELDANYAAIKDHTYEWGKR